VRIVEPGSRGTDEVISSATVFGFRADGETLVIRRDGEVELVDWSTKTHSGHTSAFALASHGASAICLSPDDVHLIAVDADGAATWRSRLSDEVVSLVDPTTLSSTPTSCAFSPSGQMFALAYEDEVSIFSSGKSAPDRSLKVPGAQRVGWTIDGRFVTFMVFDTVRADDSGLFYRWAPEREHADAYATGSLADVDPKRHQIIDHGGCCWSRRSFDGKLLGEDKPSVETCFHVHVHDVAVAPSGAFIAAAEGEWGASSLVLRSLP
jgi:hypothetical protein